MEAERQLSREAVGCGSKTILQLRSGAGSEGNILVSQAWRGDLTSILRIDIKVEGEK